MCVYQYNLGLQNGARILTFSDFNDIHTILPMNILSATEGRGLL